MMLGQTAFSGFVNMMVCFMTIVKRDNNRGTATTISIHARKRRQPTTYACGDPLIKRTKRDINRNTHVQSQSIERTRTTSEQQASGTPCLPQQQMFFNVNWGLWGGVGEGCRKIRVAGALESRTPNECDSINAGTKKTLAEK